MTSKQINQSAIRPANPRTRPCYNRRCKWGNSTTIDSLPDELLFEILTRVSAQDIHRKARFVCKRWKRLIGGNAFASEHLHRTSYGLLLPPWRRPAFVTAAQGGEIEVSKLNCKLITSPIKCSCNGLITWIDFCERPSLLCIVNPATKRRFDLPRFFDTAVVCRFVMAYAAASMEYKVVATYTHRHSSFSKPRQLAIITVGVDNAWRRVATQQLSPEAKNLLHRLPFMTEGFVHWPSSSGDGVLTMNVETEVFTESHAPLCPLPHYKFRGSKYRCYLSTGRYLSVLIPYGDLLWGVWEMKPETGEWRKPLRNNVINLKAHLHKKDVDYPEPAGWVKYPEVLLFFLNNWSIIIYDLDNDKIESVALPDPISQDAVLHKHSLVWLS